jgi:hypothetical protein
MDSVCNFSFLGGQVDFKQFVAICIPEVEFPGAFSRNSCPIQGTLHLPVDIVLEGASTFAFCALPETFRAGELCMREAKA